MITPQEYEKLVLSAILRYPDSQDLIPQKITFELSADRFTSKPHQLIYSAIQNLVVKKTVPNVANVASELNSHLEQVGGLSYLQSLISFLPDTGTNGYDGYENWMRKVDESGRLFKFRDVIVKYNKSLEDFEKAFGEITDTEEFYQKFVSQLDNGTKARNSYEDISCAVDIALRRFEQAREGQVIDLIESRLPSLERFHIPRPASFGVIAGLPSMGKTQLAIQIAVGVAINLYLNHLEGFVSINSLETSKDRIAERIACLLSSIDSQKMADGRLEENEIKRYYLAMNFVKRLPIKINDNPDITSSQFVSQAVSSHLYYGKRVLGVSDYTELFADKQTDSEEQRVANIVKNVRRVCWITGSCEILISQFSNKASSNPTKIGHLASARYSGAVGQAADWFIEVYNPIQMKLSNLNPTLPDGKREDAAYILVEKNKEYRVGESEFLWIPEYKQFIDLQLSMNQVYRDFNQSTMKEEDF
jgi:replicative DNA helicase